MKKVDTFGIWEVKGHSCHFVGCKDFRSASVYSAFQCDWVFLDIVSKFYCIKFVKNSLFATLHKNIAVKDLRYSALRIRSSKKIANEPISRQLTDYSEQR